MFDQKNYIGETFTEACKKWQEDIAGATGPDSGTVERITNLSDAKPAGLPSANFNASVIAIVKEAIARGQLDLRAA